MIYEKYQKMYEACSSLYPDISMPKSVEKNMLIRKYNEGVSKVNDAFKQALIEEYGLENYPKKKNVIAYAWQEGHSFGYFEVENYLIDIIDTLVL